jgi:hypothetical protein
VIFIGQPQTRQFVISTRRYEIGITLMTDALARQFPQLTRMKLMYLYPWMPPCTRVTAGLLIEERH